jgi:hypothetical protein
MADHIYIANLLKNKPSAILSLQDHYKLDPHRDAFFQGKIIWSEPSRFYCYHQRRPFRERCLPFSNGDDFIGGIRHTHAPGASQNEDGKRSL